MILITTTRAIPRNPPLFVNLLVLIFLGFATALFSYLSLLGGVLPPFSSSIITYTPTRHRTPPPLLITSHPTSGQTLRSVRRHFLLSPHQGSIFPRKFKGTTHLCLWRTREVRGGSLETGIAPSIGPSERMARVMFSDALRVRHFYHSVPLATRLTLVAQTSACYTRQLSQRLISGLACAIRTSSISMKPSPLVLLVIAVSENTNTPVIKG